MNVLQPMQSISNQVLEALIQPKLTDEEKANIIAEGFAKIEKQYLSVDTFATKVNIMHTEHTLTSEDLKATESILQVDIRTSESKLTKEIETLRKETETLRKETEAIRLETKNLEVTLTKEIEAVRKEIEAIRLETKNLEVKLTTDIKNLEVKLTTDIKNLEVKLTTDIKNLEVKLTSVISENNKTTIKWMIGLVITMIAAIISLGFIK